MKPKPAAYPTLITGIGALLEQSRRAVARSVNCLMTATYWEVGRRIVEFEQRGQDRADYGEGLLMRLAKDLTARHGRGFAKSNLASMRAFYLANAKIFQTVSGKSRQLTSGDAIFQTPSGKSSALVPIAQTVSAKSSSPIFQTPSEKYATPLRKFSAQDWCCSFVALVNQRASKVSLVTSAATC